MKKSAFDMPPGQFALDIPPTINRIIAALPSEAHVRALQKLLGNKINQGTPIPYNEFLANRTAFKDDGRLIFIEANGFADLISKLYPRATFFSDEVFYMANGLLVAKRDRSGRRWGDVAGSGLSADVLNKFQEVYASMAHSVND